MRLVIFLGVGLGATACGSDSAGGPNDTPDASSRPDAAVEYSLTVSVSGEGSGSVNSSPAGIDCPGNCENEFASSTVLTLTATPNEGSRFEGWSGGGCTGTDPCEIIVSAATNISATFAPAAFDLRVAKEGTGGGSVTSEPMGISCGEACTSAFDEDTVVTLSATADSDSTFTGWSGGGCSGTDLCVITMSAATTVVASFDCSGSLIFDATGVAQNFDVPSCATSLSIDALGASGGTTSGGLGGRAQGRLSVTGGETLVVMVGGSGTVALAAGDAAGYRGGFNGGGDVFEYGGWTSGNAGRCGTGGGASDVRLGGSELANRIIVAGGGGGGGRETAMFSAGGSGGGVMGEDAPTFVFGGGAGGTQKAGGVAVQCCGAAYPTESGSLGQGGAAYRDNAGSGGGGGGYYGGGAGSFDGGGGGSSYIDGLSDSSTTPAVNDGDGSVVLSWSTDAS